MPRDTRVTARRLQHTGVALACALLFVTVEATAGGSPDSGRVEAMATTSLNAIFPSYGGRLSVRTGTGIAVEGGVEMLPWLIEDGDEAWLIFYAQARFPWRESATRRRTLTLGLSSTALIERDWVSDGPGQPLRPTNRRLTFHPALMPHGGIAWHWRTDRRVQLRLDVQALVPLGQPIPIPRATFGIGWGGLTSSASAVARRDGGR